AWKLDDQITETCEGGLNSSRKLRIELSSDCARTWISVWFTAPGRGHASLISTAVLRRCSTRRLRSAHRSSGIVFCAGSGCPPDLRHRVTAQSASSVPANPAIAL